ncbi:MAG: hypothetical protein AAB780_01290 [Patescibacteria group bacterium]
MPSTTRVEIPEFFEISNRRLGYLARKIRPVVSLTTLPEGIWPADEVRTYFLKLPKDLREHNFLLEQSVGQPVRFAKVHRLQTYHIPGSAGSVFHPTIAEVLAQIPKEYIGETVAFETFLETYNPSSPNGWHHQATTVLLRRASPVSGTQRTHYR